MNQTAHDNTARTGEPRTYAGIGSRGTPDRIQMLMADIAEALATRGWVLRSGGARGADTAFETGCDRAQGRKEICIPWQGFAADGKNDPTKRSTAELGVYLPQAMQQAEELSAQHWQSDDVAWRQLRQGTRKLMARNACQVLGQALDSPTTFVLYWRPADRRQSGTDQALRIARANKIECIPIVPRTDPAALIAWVEQTYPATRWVSTIPAAARNTRRTPPTPPGPHAGVPKHTPRRTRDRGRNARSDTQ